MFIIKGLMLCLFFTFTCHSEAAVNDSRIFVENKDTNFVEFSVALSDDLLVKNVVFKEAPITKKWLLIIKRENIHRSLNNVGMAKALSIEEFSLLLDKVIMYLKSSFPNNSIDQIQTSIGLVDNTWQSVVNTVRASAKNMEGAIDNKNDKILFGVISCLLNSSQMEETCNILYKNILYCDREIISINPIVFKDQYINKPWSSIADTPDSGLSDKIWFGINVKDH